MLAASWRGALSYMLRHILAYVLNQCIYAIYTSKGTLDLWCIRIYTRKGTLQHVLRIYALRVCPPPSLSTTFQSMRCRITLRDSAYHIAWFQLRAVTLCRALSAFPNRWLPLRDVILCRALSAVPQPPCNANISRAAALFQGRYSNRPSTNNP